MDRDTVDLCLPAYGYYCEAAAWSVKAIPMMLEMHVFICFFVFFLFSPEEECVSQRARQVDFLCPAHRPAVQKIHEHQCVCPLVGSTFFSL